MAAHRRSARRADGPAEAGASKRTIEDATQAFLDREIVRLRRTVAVPNFSPLSDTDLAALRSGIDEHQRVVALVEQHIAEQRRVGFPTVSSRLEPQR